MGFDFSSRLDFDCVNMACPRRGFCQRADWTRGAPRRKWQSDFGGGAKRKECPWFVPTPMVDKADLRTETEFDILRGLNKLREWSGDNDARR